MKGDAPSPSSPAKKFGAPRDASVPRMEDVRVTAPDLNRRAALEKTRGRLVLSAGGFALLFAAIAVKLADATIVQPLLPKAETVRRPEPPKTVAAGGSVDPEHPTATPVSMLTNSDAMPHALRAMITDRNGQILAISLPTSGLYGNPRVIIDPADVAHKLIAVLPKLDEKDVARRLADQTHQFVYLARQVTARERLAINGLGIPGLEFQNTERREYPQGRMAAHVIGGVDIDEHGVAGIEQRFEQRLHDDGTPLKLSIDVRVQAVIRDELIKAMTEFQAIGACGIVMDVRTGEVLGLVSLPDYDANEFGKAPPDDRFDRAVTGKYEPGSTFKLQTVSMALDDGVVNIWNGFDASVPIKIGRFTISDFEGKHRWLTVPEIIAYSSNIGAAKMAQAVGSERQRAWFQKLGLMTRSPIELPGAGLPLFPAISNWGEAATLTMGFGHGIAVSPIHVVSATAAVANGGTYHPPTILALGDDATDVPGTRIMQLGTSDIVRKLMRLVVTDGYGKAAEVPGYFVGGKTGTAEKVSHRGYAKHSNVSAFMSAFPMNSPRYAVYMMLDEPKADASTHGYATAGWVSAPAAGRVIARIGPMLGLLPETTNAAAIQATLAIPLVPSRPAGARGPATPPPAPKAESVPVARNAQPVPGTTVLPANLPGHSPVPRDMRHEARYLKTANADE